MPSAKAPTVYRVVVLRPTDQILGGDPAHNEKAAKRYANSATAITVTTMAKKNFRNLKKRAHGFFTTSKQKPADYTVEERWAFTTYKEARDKVLYEAFHCSHFIDTLQTWIKL